MLLIISRSGLIFKCLEMKGDKKLKQSYDVLNGSQQNLQENSNTMKSIIIKAAKRINFTSSLKHRQITFSRS